MRARARARTHTHTHLPDFLRAGYDELDLRICREEIASSPRVAAAR